MKRCIAVIVIFLFLFLNVSQSDAQEMKPTGSLRIAPAYTEITLSKPNEEQKISLTLTNYSSQPLTLSMFPLDFNQSDANGTISFLAKPGSYSYSLASFLSLEASTIVIDPNESKVFTAVVRNRPDLSPGGHYAGIIGKIIPGENQSLGANVAPSISSLIFLKKTGGERYNLSLNTADHKDTISFSYPKSLRLQFQNEGNIHLVPYGVLEIKDSFGRILKRGVLNTSSFMVLPESRRNIIVTLDTINRSFPLSLNTLTINGNDSLKKTTFIYRNTFLYINPFLLMGIVGGIFIIFFIKRRRKGQNKKNEQSKEIVSTIKDKKIRTQKKKI